MPLSELIYGLCRGKIESSQKRSAPICSTDLSSLPRNDFHELIWENGQIQSSKGRKIQASKGFPSQNLRVRDKDSGDETNSKCSTMEPLLNEVQISVPSVVTDLNHDDNTVPWLNYQVDKRVQHDYDSELLPELSTVTVTEHSSRSSFAALDGRSSDRNSATQLCPSLSQQHHTSFPYFRSRVLANDGENIDNVTYLAGSAVHELQPWKVNAKPLEAKLAEEHAHVELTEALDQDDSKKDKNCCNISVESARKDFTENERSTELAVASSSVCSGNSTERNLDDPTHNLKRKDFDHEESEGLVEDAEKESVAEKKATPIRRVTGSKRARAAEVHNLSERKRRDRINEKMRALQELIPNCNNKVDKASILDEAIEYLKTLQLQVQMMSMGAGFYMPPMTMPLGVPHVHAAQMAQFYPLDIGIAVGFGMGMPKMYGISSTCPMLQVPPFRGAQFHGPLPSTPSALHGMGGSNLQMFGVCGQGLPLPFQPPPMMPMSAGSLLQTRSGSEICSMVGPRKNLLHHLVQTSKAADNGALELVTGNNNASCEGAGECALKS
ncbi:hypothetical protein K2173_003865 [Erythroxylum novogranatense]|uniref:BHLH domain-containing protein n=1 Tax=Erythroxylum novogranatense TaxID=1862640 RepID=A0AAV8SJI1_9ROSI|nr:hypothetical protein K2173_003865 [Erythroxylum novogranatense]